MGLLAPSAIVVMLWLTDQGPGVSRDSIVYIGTARSLAEGNGFYSSDTQPMTQFGPGYPLLLAATGLVVDDPARAVRWLQAFLLGANVVLFGSLLHLATERDALATACGTLLFLCSVPALTVHYYAWSEPLFLTFALAGFLLLCRHLEYPSWLTLLATATCFGLASATRYAGVTLLPPLVAGLLFMGGGTLGRRVRDTIVALVLACTPLGLWLIRNTLISGAPTNRSVVSHPPTVGHLRDLVHTVHDFVLPVPMPGRPAAVYLGLLSALLAAGLVLLCRERFGASNRAPADTAIPVLSALFAVGSVAFLVLSIWLLDARISFIDRLMVPTFAFATVAFVSTTRNVARTLRRPIIWSLGVGALLLSVAVNGGRSFSWGIETHRNGLGYTSRRWLESETMAFVRSVPSDVKVYSNDPLATRFLTGREAVMIPAKWFRATLENNQDYDEELRALCQGCKENAAVVVYLSAIKRRHLPTPGELAASCGFPAGRVLADGTVYGE